MGSMRKRSTTALALLVALSFFVTGTVLYSSQSTAQESVEQLRAKITESQNRLAEIEKEIHQFELELNKVGAEKQTLNKAIAELDLARKKIQSEVKATEQKINSTDLEISELDREITVKEIEIDRNTEALGESFRLMDTLEDETLVETLLSRSSLAEAWDAIESQSMFQESVRADIRQLLALKTAYERALGRSVDKREELGVLHEELSGEVQAVEQTKKQKDSLLDQTANKEANYQKILAAKRADKEQFERQMRQFEAQLQFILDKSTIPAVGSGVLAWPFEPSYMRTCPSFASALGNSQCLTQSYGNTNFARGGAYNGQGHNGIDFRAPIGTTITAALAGTVQDVNHGVAPNCQYGKWVLVKHANGLTTLYAHLSSISVTPGQSVATGQLLGYSGDTGYATGPHLHFTVYASAAVQFKQYTCNSGPTVKVPVAAFTGYLNPLDYL